jgi:hypothetical protein
MLKNIVIDAETQQITVDSAALIAEAETRTHKSGPKTYVERLITGQTRLRRNPNYWPEEKKLEVATLYAAGVVNSTELERLTAVPATAVREWRTTEWWPELLERIHASIDEEVVSKLTNIVDKALDVVQDRLINGEYMTKTRTDKITGEVTQTVTRKPVSMRDATAVAHTVVDKRQLLRGKPTSRAEKVTVNSRLEQLAAEFQKFAQAKEIQGEVVNEIETRS